MTVGHPDATTFPCQVSILEIPEKLMWLRTLHQFKMSQQETLGTLIDLPPFSPSLCKHKPIKGLRKLKRPLQFIAWVGLWSQILSCILSPTSPNPPHPVSPNSINSGSPGINFLVTRNPTLYSHHLPVSL